MNSRQGHAYLWQGHAREARKRRVAGGYQFRFHVRYLQIQAATMENTQASRNARAACKHGWSLSWRMGLGRFAGFGERLGELERQAESAPVLRRLARSRLDAGTFAGGAKLGVGLGEFFIGHGNTAFATLQGLKTPAETWADRTFRGAIRSTNS